VEVASRGRDVICAVFGCGVEEVLIPEPELVKRTGERQDQPTVASSSPGRTAGDAQAPGRTIAPASLRCRPEDPVTAPPERATEHEDSQVHREDPSVRLNSGISEAPGK